MDNFVIPDIQPVDNILGGEIPVIPSGFVVESIGNGLYQMQLPDGSTQIVNGVGEIISSN